MTVSDGIRIDNVDFVGHIIFIGSLNSMKFWPPNITESNYDVPEILHFIWIGHKPLPDRYLDNVESYQKMNPNYKIYLWLELAKLSQNVIGAISQRLPNVTLSDPNELRLINQDLYDRPTLNIGVKADLLRYEIVYQYGGIYCDIDSISVKPFNPNIFKTSFVTHILTTYKNLSNAAFGFPKGSSFLDYVMTIIRKQTFWISQEPTQQTGPAMLTSAFINFNDSKIQMVEQKYLIGPNTNISFTYHTNDGNWLS